MMNAHLHRQPVAIDRERHRQACVRWPVTDWAVASRLNSIPVTGAEFGPACREYPVVFIAGGNDDAGQPQVLPVALLGLAPDENLFIGEGGAWRAQYLPGLLRTYPFGISRMDAQRFAVCVDAGWAGVQLAGGDGEALFGADGEPTEFLQRTQKLLEQIEIEVQRTRVFCRKLQDLGLLREVRLDATLADGQKIAVEGFMTVDEAKVKAMADADVLEMHRNGMMSLVHGHFLSMGHMQRLLDWRSARVQAAAAAASVSAVTQAA